MGSLTDVTEHKRAEEALHESEERFRSLFEESKDVVFFSTLEGKIIDVNNAGLELFGYASKEEFFELDIQQDLFVNTNDWRKHQEILFTQGYVKDFELVLKKKDGSHLNVLETSSVVTDAHGTTVAYRGIIRDVTEQKKLEDQLRQAHKLQSIGILVGGIAHNFNNILGIILGYVSMLRREKENGVRFTEGVEAIQKAVERGAALVRQLLTFARKTDVQLAIVDVNDIIRELARMVMETFPKTIAISLNLTPDLPLVKIDQNQLHQALLNLCVNSRDAMMGEGALSISTSLVEPVQLRERFEGVFGEHYIAIEVVDTGIGMDEATRNHIFEPFFTTKDIGKGTGLGLSVVYGIVKSQNGFIDLQSVQGKGTKFIIYLPVAFGSSAHHLRNDAIPSGDHGGTETVLIVEDEPSLLDLLRSLLTKKGYKVLTAKNGIEAVNSYRRHHNKIQLVLMDIGLPRLDGWESLKRMKEINPEVLVVLASGYLTPDIEESAKNQGAEVFISKPYMPEKVLLTVREVLDRAKKDRKRKH
ncbi:MAG: response regulator [Ignavibacteriales bacterium]|nr:response regulator [Ignavibacteriales bacterium]